MAHAPRRFASPLLLFVAIAAVMLQSLATAGPAFVVEHDDEERKLTPSRFVLEVGPAATGHRPLAYRFCVDPSERVAGNATPYIVRALLRAADGRLDERWRSAGGEGDFADLLNRPLEEWPGDVVGQFLADVGDVVDELLRAARAERVGFDRRFRERDDFAARIAAATPEAFAARDLGRLLLVAQRHALARGDRDRFVALVPAVTLLTEFVGGGETLIEHLIACSIDRMQNRVLLELVARDGGVNWYGALTDRPDLPVDLRRVIEWEIGTMAAAVPFARDAARRDLTPEEWQAEFLKTMQLAEEFGEGAFDLEVGTSAGLDVVVPFWRSAAVAAAIEGQAPAARSFLLRHGWQAADLEDRPNGQLIAMQTDELLTSLQGRWRLAASLEPSASVREFEANGDWWDRVRETNEGALCMTGLSVFTSALRAVGHATARPASERAALRVVEALRNHVSETGRFPRRLDEITGLHVPVDPLTGEPFAYRCDDGETGTLTHAFRRKNLEIELRLVTGVEPPTRQASPR